MTTTLRTWNLKISLSLLLCLALCGLLSAQTPTWQYVSTLGGNGQYGDNSRDEGIKDMTVDKWGNTYVVGQVGTSPDANGTAISPANYGDWDAYVAKYNRCGVLEWCYVSGSGGDDIWNSVVLDSEGNCYINGTGTNSGTSPFRFLSKNFDTTYSFKNSIGFCFKLNTKGEKIWVKTFDAYNFKFLTHYLVMSPNDKLSMLQWVYNTGNTHDSIGQGIKATRKGHILSSINIQTGNVLNFKAIDSLQPLPYYSMKLDNEENLYFILGNDIHSDTIVFVDNNKLVIYGNGLAFLKLDSNRHLVKSLLSYPGDAGFGIDDFKLLDTTIVLIGIFSKNSKFCNQVFGNPKSDVIYSKRLWVLNKNLDLLRTSAPDTTASSNDQALTGSNIYDTYMLHVSYDKFKWSNIDRPALSTPDTVLLVKVNTNTLTLDVVDKLMDFHQTAGAYSDIVHGVSDEQGNLYYAGLLGDKITIPGKSVTPKGGQPSPDGFVLKWGLPCSDTTHALIPPKDPSKLIATAASAIRVNVNWSDNAQYETGYRIFRSPDGISNWTKIDSVNKNVTTYADLNVQPNNVYWYKVQGYNAIGATDWTNIDSAKTPMTIGITEITGVSYLNVFPNPTKGNTVTIELAQEKAAVYQVALTDLSGRTLQYFNWNTEAGSNKKTIEVSGLSKGIYSFSLRTASARLTRELVVVE